MRSSAAPLSEIGYSGPEQVWQGTGGGLAGSSWWEGLDEEVTPELRWPASVPVYNRMRRQDGQVASVLRAVVLPILRTKWWIEPDDASAEVTAQIADDFGLPLAGEPRSKRRRNRDRFSFTGHLAEALTSLPLGHAFFEQLCRLDPATRRPRLHKLALRPASTIADIRVASDGGLVAIEQRGVDRVIPVSRLVAYTSGREGGNWAGVSLLRPAYKFWLLKDRALRTQAQVIERNGLGIPVYKMGPEEESNEAGLAIAQGYRGGSTAGVALPQGAELSLIGVSGALPDADKVIRYYDEQIARAVLAHFLNLGTETGSWALGSTFSDFFTLGLQTIAETLRDVIQQHVIEDLVDWGWGEDEPAPRLAFAEIGSQHYATAESIQSLVAAGVLTPDETLQGHMRRVYGLPAADPAPPPDEVPEAEAGLEVGGDDDFGQDELIDEGV